MELRFARFWSLFFFPIYCIEQRFSQLFFFVGGGGGGGWGEGKLSLNISSLYFLKFKQDFLPWVFALEEGRDN